jgi:apolipoprotein D and lipocalin family protein
MKRKLLMLVAMVSMMSCTSTQDLPTVERVDLTKYQGLWYELARLPNSFEKGLECVTATYTLKSNGKIDVRNRGYSTVKGKYKSARGTARVPDPDEPGKLKVSFFWPFSGNYYILKLDDEYRYALVGDPSRKYLWILSRTKDLDAAVYTGLMDHAKINGFNTDQVTETGQQCE